MGRRFITLASMALLALTIATGATATHATMAPVTEFTDPAGDSGTAADITTVDVTNDEKGQYFIDVTFGTPYGPTAGMSVLLDTDLNPSTGDPQAFGADYLFGDDHANHAFYFLKWNGTTWDDTPGTTATVSIAPDNMHVTLSVNKSEMGDSTGFNFLLASIDGDGSNGNVDVYPTGTTSQYKLQTVVQLQLSLVAAKAFAVKAGGTWNVALIVGRSDTGGTVGPEGTLVCSATSGSTKLKVSGHAFVSGGSGKPTAAVCSFSVPKKLKHKVLHATATVSYQGLTVKHSFTTTAK